MMKATLTRATLMVIRASLVRTHLAAACHVAAACSNDGGGSIHHFLVHCVGATFAVLSSLLLLWWLWPYSHDAGCMVSGGMGPLRLFKGRPPANLVAGKHSRSGQGHIAAVNCDNIVSTTYISLLCTHSMQFNHAAGHICRLCCSSFKRPPELYLPVLPRSLVSSCTTLAWRACTAAENNRCMHALWGREVGRMVMVCLHGCVEQPCTTFASCPR